MKRNPNSSCSATPTTLVRDAGPSSTRITAKGALLVEAGQVVDALAGGMMIDQVRNVVLGGSLLSQPSINSRKGIWDRIRYRHLTHRIGWAIASLIETHRHGNRSDEFVSLLYLHYALRDRLTYDCVTEMLWHKNCRNRVPAW